MKAYIGPYPKDNEPQIVEIEIHDYDTWNMDKTLAQVIHPMLVAFCGEDGPRAYPGGLSGTDEWREILNKMIWAFDAILREWDFEAAALYESDYLDQVTLRRKKIQEGLDLFAKYFTHLWN